MLLGIRNKSLFMFIIMAALIGLTACSGTASASIGPVDVQITLSDFTITSSLTTFTVGVAYHFTVKNEGSTAHELQIMPPTTDLVIQDQIQKMALAGIGQNDLPAGATKTLDYTFTQAYPQGTLEFACHLPGHYESGMKLPIVVNK